jgi:hypothetical protein
LTYLAKYGDTIFDVALIAYQDASLAYQLIKENPAIESIDSDLTGILITYTPQIITTKEVIKTPSVIKRSVTISSDQSVFDIALQYFGGAENVYSFIKSNGLESILSDPTGLELNYQVNKTFVPEYFRQTGGNVANKYPIIVSGIGLLQEDGTLLLQEDGTAILLE